MRVQGLACWILIILQGYGEGSEGSVRRPTGTAAGIATAAGGLPPLPPLLVLEVAGRGREGESDPLAGALGRGVDEYRVRLLSFPALQQQVRDLQSQRLRHRRIGFRRLQGCAEAVSKP